MPFDLDRYQSSLLNPNGIGSVVLYVESTASTMDDARLGADEGGGCGTAYVAGQQTAGRGRQGRSWVSAPGTGLYVTYHLCAPESEEAALFAIAGALAVADAVRVTTGVETNFKWPNDILLNGRKLCGVLAESRISNVPGRGVDVFLGIGLNLRTNPNMPPDIAPIATSLEEAGVPVPELERLLAALSDALDVNAGLTLTEPGIIVGEWRNRLGTLGRHVHLATPSGAEIEGDAIDVTSRGELILHLDDGSAKIVAAGDVTTLR